MTVFVSPAEGRLTSAYGPRERHPVTGVTGFHKGEDIAPPIAGTRGWPLYAALAGVVTHAGGARKPLRYVGGRAIWPSNPVTGTWNTGTYVIIRTDYGPTLYYGHPEDIYVKPGQRVKAGDLIGTMGNVGNVTGIHLHFEVWKNSDHNTHYNPRLLFKEFGVAPGSAPVLTKNPSNPFGEDWLTEMFGSKGEFRTWLIDEVINPRLSVQNDALTRMVDNRIAAAEARIVEKVAAEAGNVHRSVVRDVPRATALETIGITTNTEPRSLWTMLRQAANGTVDEAAIRATLREAVAAEMPEEFVAEVDAEAIANRVAETFGARLSNKYEETV